MSLGFDDIGSGISVLIIHGAYSTRHETRGALEPFFADHDGYRRLYVDLPGMGDSPGGATIQTSNDVVAVVNELVEAAFGSEPLLVIGHSYGAHVARGIAACRPEQVRGIALICPLIPAAMEAEPHQVVAAEGDVSEQIDPALADEYKGYFVIHTPETARRFNQAVAPAIGRFDADTVERMMERWQLDPDPDTAVFDGETLIVTGRHDSFVGFRRQSELIDRYRRATYVVAGGAGHALPHERPQLLAALLSDWLGRIG
jgi:pimeloyl-ACP methyl ester carboxylesterase